MSENVFLKTDEVCKRTTFSRTQIWKLEKENDTFPKSIRMGRRKVFVESEIQDWIDQQIASRDAMVA